MAIRAARSADFASLRTPGSLDPRGNKTATFTFCRLSSDPLKEFPQAEIKIKLQRASKLWRIGKNKKT
jgi:hypothetical protein